MKVLILAGGRGTRLMPLTKDTNKHLLPIHGKPMIFYVLDNVVSSGLNDIVLVHNEMGRRIPGVVDNYVSSRYQGVFVDYVRESENSLGIANAIKIARREIGLSDFVVVFGDVIFEKPLKSYIESFDSKRLDAKFLLGHAMEPSSHASVFFEGEEISRIEEKCENPPNDLVVTTYDIYTPNVWDYIDSLKPSARGELEITDLRNLMIQNHRVGFSYVDGWWMDVGTHERLAKAKELLS